VLSQEIVDAVSEIDPGAQVTRNWDRVINYLETGAMSTVEVVVDVLGREARVGLEHLQELWRLRAAYNYSPVPLYFGVSCTVQPAALRYEIRRSGGRFMYASEASSHFRSEMEEIQIQLSEVKTMAPHWEIIQENYCDDAQRVYVQLRFSGKTEGLQGSDRHRAVLAVMLKNNGIPRSMSALRQLCAEDRLFTPAGGPLDVPQLATLKMYIFRDFPEYLQRAFDALRSGHHAERIIQHVDLGTKAMGFRIRGRWTLIVR
jgi:hypothetical protein